MEKLMKLLVSPKIENIVLLVGPGISEASGVPDFYSTEYIQSLIKSTPENESIDPKSIFDLESFKQDARPIWWAFCKSLPSFTSSLPTSFHFFIKILHKQDKLLRCYTQCIDNLEIIAGVPDRYVIQSNGKFDTCHCIACGKEFPLKFFIKELNDNLAVANKLTIEKTIVPICDYCNSKYVKPNVVFIHEELTAEFFAEYQYDFEDSDLLIIAGTDLNDEPFSSLPDSVKLSVNRFFIGKKKPLNSSVFNFKSNRDFFIDRDYQEFAIDICEIIGWDSALKSLLANRKVLGFNWFGFDKNPKKNRITPREQEVINSLIFSVQLNMPIKNQNVDQNPTAGFVQNQNTNNNNNSNENQIQFPIIGSDQIQNNNYNNNNYNNNFNSAFIMQPQIQNNYYCNNFFNQPQIQSPTTNVNQNQDQPHYSIIERPSLVFRS